MQIPMELCSHCRNYYAFFKKNCLNEFLKLNRTKLDDSVNVFEN